MRHVILVLAITLAGCLAINHCPDQVPNSPVIHSGFVQLNHTSCGSPHHWPFHSYPIPVQAEHGLQDSYAGAAEEAVGIWNGLVGREFLRWEGESSLGAEVIRVSQTDLPSTEEERTLGDATTDVDAQTGVIRSARIRLDLEISRKIQVTVMMHEIGHSLGLRHDDRDPASTMFPLVWDRRIQRVTSEDVAVIRDLVPEGLDPATHVSEEPPSQLFRVHWSPSVVQGCWRQDIED